MKKETLTKVAVVGGVAIVAILMMHQRSKNNPIVDALDTSPSNAGFENPYYENTPGSNNTYVLNGGPPFLSALNVDVHPELLGYLSQKYIPMFGFVGITAGYTQVTRNIAPAPAVQQMSVSYTPPPAAASALRMSFGARNTPFPTYH